MTLITLDPKVRVNDEFITERNIVSCGKINNDIKHKILNDYKSNNRFRADFYKYIALDIVNETVFHYPYPYISEKTLRPIAEKRIFILLAPKNTLNFLHSIGFKSFSDIIDESYDTVDDPELRLLAVADSIKKFCDIDLEEIKEYMIQNKNKFEHNFNLLSNYRDLELSRLAQIIEEPK